MIRYEKTFYFTPYEAIYSVANSSYEPPFPTPTDEQFLNPAAPMVTNLISIVEDYDTLVTSFSNVFSIVAGHARLAPHVDELLYLLFSRYAQDYSVVARLEGFPWEDVDANLPSTYKASCFSFIRNLCEILSSTYNRYASILSAYSDAKGHLMDTVTLESKALQRFNDAPQNAGDYSGDDYTTNYQETKGEQDSDHGTPIQRVDEIQRAYRDALSDWAREFKGLFILRSNVQ